MQPWHFTTLLDLFDHWQTLIAGAFALIAAWLALRAARRKERREVEAMRKSLAVEIRRLVELLHRRIRASASLFETTLASL
jgi:hypothetical protein